MQSNLFDSIKRWTQKHDSLPEAEISTEDFHVKTLDQFLYFCRVNCTVKPHIDVISASGRIVMNYAGRN